MNFDILMFLFNDYIGGADNDDLIIQFKNTDLNNKKERINFIESNLKNQFLSHFDDLQKEDLFVSLEELKSKRYDILKEINNQLFPFNFPKDISGFFDEIYTILLNSNHI